MTSCTECKCVVITVPDHAVYLFSEESDVSLVTKSIAFSNCIILIPCDKQYFCRKKITHTCKCTKVYGKYKFGKEFEHFCGSLSFLLRTVISLKAQWQWHNKIGTNQQEMQGTREVNGL